MPKKRYYDKMKSKQEGNMVSGPLGIALMPTNLIMSYYPKDGSYLAENINDGISGIAKQTSGDVSGTKKNLSKTKY